MYDFITSQKDYVLLRSHTGTFKITYHGEAVAHPATEEQAIERLGQLTGSVFIKPDCWNWCRIQSCQDCDRYY